MNTGEGLTKSLNNLIQQKVDQAIKEVQKQMMPGRFSEGGATPRPGTTPPGTTPPGTTPPGTTPTNPGRPGSYPSGVYIGPPGDTDGEQTGLDMNLSGGIGTPIYAPRDLIYRSKGTDGNPSVGLQGTADVLGPSGSGFGYYGAYRFKEGNTEYEVLMGHFRNLPYRGAKDGDIIPKGTLLGYQGASGRTIGQGNKPYPHISLHLNGVGFQASNQKLVEFAESLVQSGGTAPPAAQTPPGQQPLNPIFQRPGQTPPPAPGQQPLNPIFQPPGQTPPAAPGQQPAKKSYNGLTSFYGTNGNEPEKPPRDGFGYDPGKKTTASGAPFIPSGLTAAHKTLPFGTKLRVTNPNNGKSVIVTVNDRGPFSGNRVLDLSYGAAKSIGMVGSGTINAKIEELKGGGYVTSPNGQRIREFITPGTKDKMPTILDKMPTPMEIRKKNFFEKGSIASYPSYSTEGGMMIAIQPIIIEKTVPVPMRSSRGISFPVAGVNNSMGNSSSLNQG
jgi:rare lipoprotein A